MLIVSKFHDYYDTAAAYGIDKTCVYKREEKSIEVKENPSYYSDKERWPHIEHLESKSGKYEVHKLVLGFCGEVYPMLHIVKNKIEDFYFWDMDSVSEFLATEEIGRSRYWFSEREYRVTDSRDLNRFYDQSTWSKLLPKFYEHNTPVFLHGRISNQKLETRLNVRLKDIRFMVVKDPQTAHQEIYMYLSGVLGAPPKPTKPIDDKIMAASKGHDGEYSFRKPPGKRGKKQWR